MGNPDIRRERKCVVLIVLSRDRQRVAHSNCNRLQAAFCFDHVMPRHQGWSLTISVRPELAHEGWLALFDAKKPRIYAEGILSL